MKQMLVMLGAVIFLSGCDKGDVKYADLSPGTTATVSSNTVTIHLGSDMMASACWTVPKAKVDGHTVYVVGYRTLREQSREFVVNIPANMGQKSVRVVWVDPDGSQVSVPTKGEKAEPPPAN